MIGPVRQSDRLNEGRAPPTDHPEREAEQAANQRAIVKHVNIAIGQRREDQRRSDRNHQAHRHKRPSTEAQQQRKDQIGPELRRDRPARTIPWRRVWTEENLHQKQGLREAVQREAVGKRCARRRIRHKIGEEQLEREKRDQHHNVQRVDPPEAQPHEPADRKALCQSVAIARSDHEAGQHEEEIDA